MTFVGVHGTALYAFARKSFPVSPHRVSPLFSATQVYDSNLFSASVAPQGDFITRLSPGIEGEYRSPRSACSGVTSSISIVSPLTRS